MLDLGGFVPLVRFQYCFSCQTHCKQITLVCKWFVATLKGGCVIYFWVSLSKLFLLSSFLVEVFYLTVATSWRQTLYWSPNWKQKCH